MGTVGVPACYGGFETLVENLLDDSGDKSRSITVYCSAKSYPEKLPSYKNAILEYIPLKANGIQSIPYDVFSITHAAFKKSDSILVLGVSGAICLPLIRAFSRAKIITNIDGLEWRRDKWGSFVKKFLKISERIAVRFSDIVIADNQAIADYIKNEYFCESKVIAYGGDHAVSGKLNDVNGDYALALCRIEPENNVELILEGFSRSRNKLKFIGNWQNSDFGKKMHDKYSRFENIELLDPVYDTDKLFDIRNDCSFYVHGHSAGGTNPSLVEMMHFSKNILAFDCEYNRASTENKAIYFSNADQLVNAIENIESVNLGQILKNIAMRRYTWDIVRKQYLELLY